MVPAGNPSAPTHQMLTISDVVYEVSETDNFAIVHDLLSPNAEIQRTVRSGSKTVDVTGIRDYALWTLIHNSLPIPAFLVRIGPVAYGGAEPVFDGTADRAKPWKRAFTWSDRVPHIDWSFWFGMGPDGQEPEEGEAEELPPGPPVPSIAIPDRIERICAGAFCNWDSLVDVQFGINCAIRELDGFFRCGLRSVTIPDSVEVIGEHAFLGCESMTSIVFGPNSRLKTVNGFRHVPIVSIDLPDSVEVLGRRAFAGCQELTRMNFGPGSRLRILDGLKNCAFEVFAVPDSVEELGRNCFCECNLLREITFGANSKLKRMYGPGFCALERFEVPDSVEVIGDGVFGGCSRLASLTFGVNSRLREIGREFCTTQEEDYLSGCNVRSVTIPASVEVIKPQAFSSCFLLERLEFAPNSKLRELNGFCDTGIAELDIPDSVEIIGAGSFCPCRKLRMVRFGQNSRLRKVGARLKHGFMRYTERYLKHARDEFEIVEDLPQYPMPACSPLGSSDDERMAQVWEDRIAKGSKPWEF
jgi:hypothetical protein